MTERAFKSVDEKTVQPYHNFETWRLITNEVSIDVGDLNDLSQDLKDVLSGSKRDLSNAIKKTYDTTQLRLRHILVKSIGMS